MITIPTTAMRADTTAGSNPAATTAASGTATPPATTNTPAGGAMGKDAFLKLLVAQMKNQDPMNPMQGDQMATQLATFSSLEQLQQINTTLTSQQTSSGSLLGAIQASSAITMIGHTVVASGNQVQVGGPNASGSVTTYIAGAGTSATLHIYDSGGHDVGSRSLGPVAGGSQTFDVGDAAKGLPEGIYTYGVDVKDASGNAVSVQTYTSGKVDGITSGTNGIVLNAGSFVIPYASVTRVIQ